MKSQSIITPNALPEPSVKNWKRPEMVTSPAMRIAQERASAAQPPIRSIFGTKETLRRAQCKNGG